MGIAQRRGRRARAHRAELLHSRRLRAAHETARGDARRSARIARDHDLQVGNVFHAGDGNLHPLLCFDRRERAQVRAVVEAGTEILGTCIEIGGTISGEHGIGYEKRDSLSLVFDSDDLAAMGRVRDVFDPRRLFNPDKIFPTGALCGEVRAPAAVALTGDGRPAHRYAGDCRRRRRDARRVRARPRAAVVAVGGSTLQSLGNAPRRCDVALHTHGLRGIRRLRSARS